MTFRKVHPSVANLVNGGYVLFVTHPNPLPDDWDEWLERVFDWRYPILDIQNGTPSSGRTVSMIVFRSPVARTVLNTLTDEFKQLGWAVRIPMLSDQALRNYVYDNEKLEKILPAKSPNGSRAWSTSHTQLNATPGRLPHHPSPYTSYLSQSSPISNQLSTPHPGSPQSPGKSSKQENDLQSQSKDIALDWLATNFSSHPPKSPAVCASSRSPISPRSPITSLPSLSGAPSTPASTSSFSQSALLRHSPSMPNHHTCTRFSSPEHEKSITIVQDDTHLKVVPKREPHDFIALARPLHSLPPKPPLPPDWDNKDLDTPISTSLSIPPSHPHPHPKSDDVLAKLAASNKAQRALASQLRQERRARVAVEEELSAVKARQATLDERLESLEGRLAMMPSMLKAYGTLEHLALAGSPSKDVQRKRKRPMDDEERRSCEVGQSSPF